MRWFYVVVSLIAFLAGSLAGASVAVTFDGLQLAGLQVRVKKVEAMASQIKKDVATIKTLPPCGFER